MVKIIKYSLLSYLFLSLCFVVLPQQKKIQQKKEELSEIKREIRQLENKYKQQSRKEKRSYASFQNYSKQNYLLNKLIKSLKKEEAEKTKQINKTKYDISELEKEIKILRENYTKYVVSIYKYGKPSDWSVFFDLSSLQRLFLRYKYLKEFSKRREVDLTKLKTSKTVLQNLKSKLEKEKREKQLLVAQKQNEEKELAKKVKEAKNLLRSIRNNKSELRKEISAKKSAKFKISNLISKLVDEERRREENARLARLNKKNKNLETEPDNYDIDLSTADFSSFSSLKGRMKWPIRNGRVIKKFGQNRNKKLNTITVNYGIDIKARSDLNVKTVAEGVVSAIDWIPGYGSVIIVSHKGNYRTVYSHLDEIFVSEGDKLKYNSKIGKVGESLNGFVLHFEIWKSRKNQNPEIWLARK